MSRVASTHADWLALLEPSGQFLTLPVIRETFPSGLDHASAQLRDAVRDQLAELDLEQPASRTGWIEFLLKSVLGWGDRLRTGVAVPTHLHYQGLAGHRLNADYALVEPAMGNQPERVRAAVAVFPHGTGLTARVPGAAWAASPVEQVAALCRDAGVPVGIVTDGDLFALVWAPDQAPSGYGIWQSTLFGEEPVLLDAFVSVLGAKRFFAVTGENQLEQLLTRSASAEQEVTAALGRQVRQAVEVLVSALSRANNEHSGQLLTGVDPRVVYQAAVTVMMRLVFLLYAEERHLLPLGDPLYDSSYAASTLREELRRDADQLGDEPLELRTSAWHRLLATFRAVHAGISHDQLRLPAYGGTLFDPDRFPFLEGRLEDQPWQTTDSTPLPVDDATVLAILTALQVLEIREAGVTESRSLSFRTLDVEQIGHCYEGLLDHGAKRVDEIAVGLVGSTAREAELPLSELEAKAAQGEEALLAWLAEQTNRSVPVLTRLLSTAPSVDQQRLLRTACENDALAYQRVLPFVQVIRPDLRGLPMVFLPGSVYVTETGDLRNSGTAYTTRDLANEVVKHALDPLLYSPGPLEGAAPDDWVLKSADEILALRICDPAVGSGAIIVAACRYLADGLVEAWTRDASFPAHVSDGADHNDVRLEARRLIADQCLYGVDRDPMAVEMAKLSLWLTTMSRERPFTFLDHALRAGDSLLGLTDIRQVETLHIDPRQAEQELQFTAHLGPRISDALAKRRYLESVPSLDIRAADEKKRLNREAQDLLEEIITAADLVVGAVLRSGGGSNSSVDAALLGVRQQVAALVAAQGDARLQLHAELRAIADSWLNQHRPAAAPLRRPLHWPLVFPEVFEAGGFHALVGNPPFQGGQMISGAAGTDVREFLAQHIAGRSGSADLVAYFFLRAFTLLRPSGTLGLIATKTISEGRTREVGLVQIAQRGGTIYRAIRSMPWPGSAALNVGLIWIGRSLPASLAPVLDGVVVGAITDQLRPGGRVSGDPVKLAENARQSFQGSIVLGKGFVLEPAEAESLLVAHPELAAVLKRYVNGEDVNNRPDSSASRYVIDFFDRDEPAAQVFAPAWQIICERVKPERQRLDDKGNYKLRKPLPQRFWQFAEKRPGLYGELKGLSRVLVCSEVTKHLNFVWLPNGWVYSANLDVFPAADDFVFGVLQSGIHEVWARQYSAHLETRLKYSCGNAFETYPRPAHDEAVERLAVDLDALRARLRTARSIGLTALYNQVHDEGCTDPEVLALRAAHVALDHAVLAAYGWSDLILGHRFEEYDGTYRLCIDPEVREELLARLLEENQRRAALETRPARATRRSSATSDVGGTMVLFPTDEEAG